MMLLVCTGTSI